MMNHTLESCILTRLADDGFLQLHLTMITRPVPVTHLKDVAVKALEK